MIVTFAPVPYTSHYSPASTAISTMYSLQCPSSPTLARQASPQSLAAASGEARQDLVCAPACTQATEKTALVREIFEHSLPFDDVDQELASPAQETPKPAEPLLRTSSLKEAQLHLHGSQVFIDRVLPPPAMKMRPNSQFTMSYFTALHSMVAAPGRSWPAWTPNHVGARIPLRHTQLKVDRWRHHLVGYENVEICQYIEYGFPLGLSPETALVSTFRNQESSYQYYPFWDKFTTSGVQNAELVGPFPKTPFPQIHISPIMTAVKKPDSRQWVF